MKFVFGVIIAGILVWLAFAENPSERRMKVINQAFLEGSLRPLQSPFEEKLQEQVKWLVRAAGITDKVTVNAGVAANRLDIIVTTPEFRSYTGCGRGNAIYDPALDAIFVDYALIIPEEIFLFGEDNAFSMVSAENSDIHHAYQNFILAHELGHRQEPNAGANRTAFFHYAATAGGAGDREAEAAADRFAVETLLNGIVDVGPPPYQEQFDILNSFFQLGVEGVAPIDHAAAEIVGAVIIMSYSLLFSASPYSPFHFDAQHPSFLERTVTALGQVQNLSVSEKAASHFAFYSAHVQALKRLPVHTFREIYFEDSVLRINLRNNELWFGTHGVPGSPTAAIYRLPVEDIHRSRSGEYVLSKHEPVARFPDSGCAHSQEDGPEADPVSWLHATFNRLSQSQGMKSNAQGLGSGETSMRPLNTPTHAVLSLPDNLKNLSEQHGLRPQDAIIIDRTWWIPAFPPHGADERQHWALWRYREGSMTTEAFRAQLLITQAGAQSDREFLRGHDPSWSDGMDALSDGRILIRIENDSMYLFDPLSNKGTLLFTPVMNGLQTLEIGEANLLIWMKNGLKAYIADLSKI